ncbi:MAG: hypothetical protein J6U54_01255 [Clostridiales bacterium]|nr:hypothetical protein [Clostridiales bacterium]
MAGTGFNYIREIMQMNLPEESTPKPLREYESEAKRRLNERFGAPKKFHYIGLTPYMPYDNNCTVKLMPVGMAGVIVCNKDELTVYNASVNDVVQHCGRLYTFTEHKHWAPFVPGPCTDYDGPNPYEKSTKPHYTYLGETVVDSYLRTHDPNVTLKVDGKGFFGRIRASQGDVIMHNGQLYTWHEALNFKYGAWCTFRPDENTDYDGPRPGEWPKKNPAVERYIELKEEIMTKKNVFEEKELCLTYIGKTTTQICENSTAARLYVEGTWISSRLGYMVMYEGRLYVCAPDGKWHDLTSTNVKTARTTQTNYSKIPYGYLLIKKVHYSGDKTIVMWADGTKTIVTKGEYEDYDPEKGLVMAIAKKAYGNEGNYYNRIKEWLPEPISEGTNLDELQSPGVYYVKDDSAKELVDMAQELIIDLTYNGATKAELVRAIKYSKELIDWLKTPVGGYTHGAAPTELLEKYGIAELRAKYQMD